MKGFKPLAIMLGLCLAIGAEPLPASAIDEFIQNNDFPGYQIESGQGMYPPVTVTLDDKTQFTLPASDFQQQVRMIQRLGHRSVANDDRLIVGVQVGGGDAALHAATLLYDQVDGQFQLTAILPMRERFNSFRLDYSRDIGSRLLILRGTSGMHFHEVWIYKYGPEGLELLATNGSAAGVHLKEGEDTDAPQVWVGVADWEDPEWNYAHGERLWNIYTWQDDGYVFNAELSTVEQKTVGRRMGEFLERLESR